MSHLLASSLFSSLSSLLALPPFLTFSHCLLCSLFVPCARHVFLSLLACSLVSTCCLHSAACPCLLSWPHVCAIFLDSSLIACRCLLSLPPILAFFLAPPTPFPFLFSLPDLPSPCLLSPCLLASLPVLLADRQLLRNTFLGEDEIK